VHPDLPAAVRTSYLRHTFDFDYTVINPARFVASVDTEQSLLDGMGTPRLVVDTERI